ncbi:MAG: TSUP family transporter [Chthoniobacteraceae bacterium]
MEADLTTCLLLAFVGLAAGFVDAVAGGGGLLTVPALLWAGLPPKLALGTNKLQSVCGTALAVFHYGRAGLFHWRDLVWQLSVTASAASLGAFAVTRIEGEFLRQLVPVLLIAIAAFFWWKPQLGLTRQSARISPITFGLLAGIGFGFYDGFFGPGTGSFWMVACILALGMDMRAATGHTKAMNLASNLGSLLVFIPAGHVHLQIALAMIAGQLVGARLGAGMVIARGSTWIRPIFLTVVILLAIRLLWQQWSGTE